MLYRVISKMTYLFLASKVFYYTYCHKASYSELPEVCTACKAFINAVKKNYPEVLTRKPKIHMLLHLPQNISDFGSTACFNTERLDVDAD